MRRLRLSAAVTIALALGASGCGGSSDGSASGARGRGRGPGGPPGEGRPAAAVPVEIEPVARRTISSYIETNGALEAENEVDIVARVAGPIVDLDVEEGDRVRSGQILARIDGTEYRADLEIAQVELTETQQAYDRAKRLFDQGLISPEAYEQAFAAHDGARARLEADRIQLGYTDVRAPFDGLIVARYVDFAETVAANTALLRLSDFDPLLCPIQVPERALPRLRIGQSAWLTVESWPDEKFQARVLRISPVVDAATGTVKVTLEVDAAGKLRPGMFARVFVETARREGALVVPKTALSLESIGDTVFVVVDGHAERRDVELGFREGDFVEIASGVREGEPVVVVGQDGLTDRTPVRVMGDEPAEPAGSASPSAEGGPPRGEGRRGRGEGGPPRVDPAELTPERIERMRQRMRERGMTDEQIDERIRQMREGSARARPE